MTALFDWLLSHDWLIASVAVVSVLTFVGTLVVIPIVVSRMSADYFVREEPGPGSWRSRHPALRIVGRVSKNALGAVLLFMGIAMLVLPGQGVLTMLIGISLVDFPGKRRLELRLARQRQVRRAIAWMRRRAKRPPLRYPDHVDDPEPMEPSA